MLHARLSILDKDARSGQPFRSGNGRYVLTFNGEIYNYRELRKSLDYPFRTESDTEVICAVFERYGQEGLKLLKGTFALAIADTVEETFQLARDPVGKKPLFVAEWSNQLLFGSSVLALAAVAHVSPQVDGHALQEYWTHGFVPPYTSLLGGARPVLPGEILSVNWRDPGSPRRESFANFAHESSDAGEPQDPEEAMQRVRSSLGAAVEMRMECSPTPIVMLSGGIDSTAVAARVAGLPAQGACRHRAVTLRSFAPMLNDELFARYAASRLDLDLEAVRIRSRTLASDVLWALDLQDEPLADIGFFALACLIRSVAKVGRVVLTGDGGDEVFGGYAPEDQWVSRESQADRVATSGTEVITGARPATWMSLWARATVTNRLIGHAMVKLDRAASEQGVEARCPLLDGELVREVRCLPPSALFRGGVTKSVLRHELCDWPGWFVNRRKRGLTYNLRWQWLLTRFEGLRDAISPSAIATAGGMLTPALRRSPHAWTDRDVMGNFAEVWKLLSLSRFLDRRKEMHALGIPVERRVAG